MKTWPYSEKLKVHNTQCSTGTFHSTNLCKKLKSIILKILKNNFVSCLHGDTSFSTLMKQFHKALISYYANAGSSLFYPSDMERFCEVHAPGLLLSITTKSKHHLPRGNVFKEQGLLLFYTT